MDVVRRAPSRRSTRGVGAAPALGALVIAFIRLGPVGTVVTAVVTFVVLVSFLRIYPIIYRRRAAKKQIGQGVALTAEASWDGSGGVIRFLDDRLDWTSKSAEHRVIACDSVREAQLSPLRLIDATRMTLLLRVAPKWRSSSRHP